MKADSRATSMLRACEDADFGEPYLFHNATDLASPAAGHQLGGLLAALLKVFGLEGRNGALESSADLADWTVPTNFTADPIRISDPEAGQARFCRLKSW